MMARSTRLGLSVFAVAGLLSPLSAFAQTTYYVSTSGSDANWGTQGSPVRTIQRGVNLANQANAAGQDAKVIVAAGVYREAVDLGGQKTDRYLIIEGAGPTTILTGADLWSTGWTMQSDGSIMHNWPYNWGMKPIPNGWGSYWTSGGNGPLRDTLRRSETVYVNGNPLRVVLSRSAMVAGTFYVDETADRLYVRLPSGVSQSTASIEVGTRLLEVKIHGRRNVTLRKFAVMRNRGAVQDIGFQITNSRNITLEDMTLRWFAYGGLATAYNTTLRFRRVSIIDNGVMALSQLRDIDTLIEYSDISRNNWRGWAAMHRGWDTVLKWGGIRDGIVRRTKFVSNWGNGFYADQDNKRLTVEYSLMASNYSKGVSLEKNQGPIVINGNRICNNLEGGMVDVQSDRVTVKNNQIFGNKWNLMFSGYYAGQTFPDWQTGTSYTAHSLYWTITGNTVVGNGTDGWLFWHTDYLAPGAWADTRNSMISLDYNTWYHSARTTAFKLPQGSSTFTTFRTDAQRANSAFESHSAWRVPTVSCTLP
jgi:hypothetical protein